MEKESNRTQSDEARRLRLREHPGAPPRITLETTNACNLRCRMCQIARPNRVTHFPLEGLQRLAGEVLPLLSVLHPTTVGEPFVYPYFDELLELLAAHAVRLDITSNGTLLDTRRSRQILPLLEDIKVSVDGASPETFEAIRVGAAWTSVMHNIRNFVEERGRTFPHRKRGAPPTITLQMTLMRSNLRELPAMVELAGELGVDNVKAYHLFAFAPDMNGESLMAAQEQYNDVRAQALALARQVGVRAYLAEPFSLAENGNGSCEDVGADQPCPLLWHEMWIDLNGDVLPCASPTRPVMGNIFRESVCDIWNGLRYQALREGQGAGEPAPMCQGCGYRRKVQAAERIPYDTRNFLYPNTLRPDYTYGLRWSSRTAQLLDAWTDGSRLLPSSPCY